MNDLVKSLIKHKDGMPDSLIANEVDALLLGAMGTVGVCPLEDVPKYLSSDNPYEVSIAKKRLGETPD